MKNLIIPGVLLLLFFSSLNLTAQWVQSSSGMTSSASRSFTSIGNNLFAGGNELYISTNTGTNWTSLNHSGELLASNNNYIFAGLSNAYGNVYKSSDIGATWTDCGMPNRCIKSIAANGDHIFIGTKICAQSNSYYFFISTDNGTSWILKPIYYYIRSLVASGNNIFAGTTGGVYKSSDNGINWVWSSPASLGPIYTLAVDGSNVIASTYFNGIYRSTDAGTTWSQTSFIPQTVYALAVTGTNIFAGTYQNGVYVSTDNGATWVQRNEGFPNSSVYIQSLYIFNNYIFAGTVGYNVYRRSLSEIVLGINPVSEQIPESYALYQNYPNPFNPKTKIKFQIAKLSEAKLIIYDVLGKEVVTLVNEQLTPGTYEVEWDATNYPSGVYYYRLISDDYNDSKKMLLVK